MMSSHGKHLHQDLGTLLLRIAVAAPFLYHGIDKLALWNTVPEGMTENMLMIMRTLSIVEPIVGALILVGLLTPIAAAIGSIVMLGAIYFKIMVFSMSFVGSTGAGWEFDLVILGGCLALLLGGAGCWSLDGMMGRKKD